MANAARKLSALQLREMEVASVEANESGGPLCPSRLRRLIEDAQDIDAMRSELASFKYELDDAERRAYRLEDELYDAEQAMAKLRAQVAAANIGIALLLVGLAHAAPVELRGELAA